MIYHDFKGLKLSALGLGCMRLPHAEGDDSRIDEVASAELLDYAIRHGINYFDTAWVYHGGQSETVMGKLLKKYPRDSFYLATKFPGFDLDLMGRVEEIFEKQLEKCGVDYFDFYLFHNVNESNIDAYLDEKYGIFDYLMKQKARGRIRHLGFSTHGSLTVMRRFLDAYGKDMEFGQLQVNWLDWTFQRAEEKVALFKEYNVPVWVMEPVRGGMLATLSPEHTARLNALRPQEKVPAWAFRFLQGVPEVVVTLSGMSNFQQFADNIRTYETSEPLNDEEMATLLEIAEEMKRRIALPCTSCRYCTAHCPQELDIPALLGLYNKLCYGDENAEPVTLDGIEEEKRPQACLGCQACEAVCPQQIRISEAMAQFEDKLRA